MFRSVLLVTSALLLFGALGRLSMLENVQAQSGCDVRDVIDHVNDGYSRNKIRDRCDDRVDVRKCSLTQVIRMVEDGDSSREIYKRCGKDPRR